jgi:hypothetical protein
MKLCPKAKVYGTEKCKEGWVALYRGYRRVRRQRQSEDYGQEEGDFNHRLREEYRTL